MDGQLEEALVYVVRERGAFVDLSFKFYELTTYQCRHYLIYHVHYIMDFIQFFVERCH